MRIAEILAAAEASAQEIRDAAQARADARIAEADRAAALRVQAADDEAADVLAQAATAAAAADHDAQARATATTDGAHQEAARIVAEAAAKGEELRRHAHQEAREIVGQAHAAARQALHEGEELSGDLQELSGSLRTNAERLLRDIRATHARLVANLDQAAPAGSGRSARPDPRGDVPADFSADVPEFLPDR